jgi:uncharacterized protein
MERFESGDASTCPACGRGHRSPGSGATPPTLPVTVVVARRPRPGREAAAQHWAHGVCAAASEFPGYLGSEVRAPHEHDRGDLVVAMSFASSDHLMRWEQSAERRSCLAAGAALTEGQPAASGITGLEDLFFRRLESGPPARWRMAVLIWLALYPAAVVLATFVAPHLAALPQAVSTLVTSLVLVPFVIYVGAPLVQRMLPWLVRGGRAPDDSYP